MAREPGLEVTRPVGDTVGVVVVHFGDAAPTHACLAAVAGDRSDVERRVVVVDNAGGFETDAARVLRCPDNPGFGGGVNRGVGAFDGEEPGAFVVLNNDVEIRDGFLAAALEAVLPPGVGAAGGPLYLDRPDGQLWYAGGGVRWLAGTVWQSRAVRDAGRPREVGFIPGSALAVSPKAWAAVGGFDERFFLYGEDLDLCLRLRRAGYALRFAPGMAAVHRVGGATGSRSFSPLYLEWMAANRFRPFASRAYRIYAAIVHSLWVTVRASWYRVSVGGERGRAAAGALWRGHRRALSGLLD